MKNNIVLGIDIGGSHITAALVDLDTRKVLEGTGQRRSVDSTGTSEEILNSWCAVINDVFTLSGISEKRIGIAMPGPFDYESGISLIQDQEKFRALYMLNLKHELCSRLHLQHEDVRFINDAAAFLQGEVFAGVAVDCNHVLGLTLGTGLGSALCEHLHAEDADLWNSPLKGKIAEDFLSTNWFLERYFQLTGLRVKGVKELTEAREYPAVVLEIFKEFGNNLAEFLFPVVENHSIKVVVLGGNISNAQVFFMPHLRQRFSALKPGVTIKLAQLKENASLIGAACSFQDAAYSKQHN
jgi:glucokinase